MALAFYIAFIPHHNYPYPLHVDEWLHLANANTILQAMSLNQILQTHYNSGNYQAVITEGNRLINKYPHEEKYVAFAYYNMGWAQFKMESWEESAKTFNSLVEKFPDDDNAAKAQIQAGEAYFNIGHYEQALNSYLNFVDKYTPKNITDRQWSEITLDKLRFRRQVEGGTGKSREEKNIIELSAIAYHKIGDCYRKLGDDLSAKDTYYLITTNFTPLPDMTKKAYLKIAEIEYESQGIDAAIKVYQEAMDKSKDRNFQAKMQLQKSKLYYEKNLYKKSIGEYKVYIKAFPDVATQINFPLAQAQYQIGHINYEIQDYNSAIPAYQAVIDSFPDQGFNAVSFYEMGLCYQNLKDYDRALEIFKKVSNEFPESDLAPLSQVQVAGVFLQIKEYDRAIEEYRKSLKLYSGNDKLDSTFVHFQIGLSFRENQQYDSALVYLQKVEAGSDYYASANSEIAEIYLSQNDFAKAENVLKSVIATLNDSIMLAEFKYYLGRLYIKAEKTEEALPQFDYAIKYLQNDQLKESALYGRGVIHFDKKNYPEARSDFQQLIDFGKEKSLINLAIEKLALSYFYTGDENAAMTLIDKRMAQLTDEQEIENLALLKIRLFQQIGKQNKALAQIKDITSKEYSLGAKVEAYFYESIIQYAIGNYPASIQAAEKSLELNEESPYKFDLYYQIGLANYQIEEYAKSAQAFGKVKTTASKEETRLFAQYYFAYSKANLGEWEEAISSFQELVREFPDSELAPEAQFQIAEAYFNLKDFQNAEKAYRIVIAKYPRSVFEVKSLYNRAWCYIEMQQIENAIGQFRILVDHYPDNEYAAFSQYTIADHYYNNKEYALAKENYKKVIDKFPDHELAGKSQELIHELNQIESYLEYEAAMVFFDEENFEEAIEALTKVINRYPDADLVPGALVNIAASYEQLGEYEDALRYYGKVIEQFGAKPENSDAVQFANEHVNWIQENY